MKKLLTATLTLLVLAASPGLSATQNKKDGDKPNTGERVAYPNADRLTLSPDPKVVSLKNECRVIVRPWYSKDNTRKYINQPVFFEKISGPGNPPAPVTTDTNGVRQITVISGQKIRAVIGTGPIKPPGATVSNEFTCNTQAPNK